MQAVYQVIPWCWAICKLDHTPSFKDCKTSKSMKSLLRPLFYSPPFGSRGRSGRPAWTSSLSDVGGLQVEVARVEGPQVKQGNQPPTVLAIHASGCSHRSWSALAPLVHGDLVAPNLYGYGQSSPWPPAPHRPPTMADLTAIVGAAAGASPPPTHLVGHSMGAGVALAAVAQLPTLPISSIAVFEPNLFCLLTLGLDHDKEVGHH